MDRIKIWMFYFRDFLVRNFMVSPKGLIYNKQLIYLIGINNLVYWILRIIPFYFTRTLLGLFNIKIIYKIDSIYNLTNINHNHIIPIIFEFLFVKADENQENFTSKIKYYNGNIPLHFIISENNFEDYIKIKIKYLKEAKIIDKNIDISNFIDFPIYKLFEN